MMNYFLVYALASWTYSAIDMWRGRAEAWEGWLEVDPSSEFSPGLFWAAGAAMLATSPLFMPFVMLEHLYLALCGGREEK